MQITKVGTTPFADQRPGTSGLRKKTRAFMKPNYLENFVQSAFNAVREENAGGYLDKPFVVGGDGRYFNRQAIQTIVRMALANGYRHVMVAKGGVLSTPATSAVIREQGASGGFILSASHNPGGIDEDFGIKYNATNGGPAQEKLTEKIFAISKELNEYLICDIPEIDLDTIKNTSVDGAVVEVFDPLQDYTALMQKLFDFDLLKSLFKSGFRMRYDAMNAATGPYAKHIIEELLGAPAGTVIRAVPLEDFGGLHPDPNQVHAKDLINEMWSDNAPDFGAASDGDGDRNMILGKKFFVTPGDSLAVITEYASSCVPGYKQGLAGVARSMPTSKAVDLVAKSLNIPCFETPTGWKFFGNLMDAEKCTICGEESFGTGSSHVREKDGLWAVLCWMSILAKTKLPVANIVEAHWKKFGRYFYQRHDHEKLDAAKAGEVISALREKLPTLVGASLGGQTITKADDFSYTDPVDGSVSAKQGIRLFIGESSRVILRLSGTGTEGATLRIYLETYKPGYNGESCEEVLSPIVKGIRELLKLKETFGKAEPDVTT